MVLKLIKSKIFGKEFRETVQPIQRVAPGKYKLIGEKFTGDESSVGMDWKQVFNLDISGFYHEHPEHFLAPSLQDDETMDSWTKATGKALVLIIKSGNRVSGWVYLHEVRIPMPPYKNGGMIVND